MNNKIIYEENEKRYHIIQEIIEKQFCKLNNQWNTLSKFLNQYDEQIMDDIINDNEEVNSLFKDMIYTFFKLLSEIEAINECIIQQHSLVNLKIVEIKNKINNLPSLVNFYSITNPISKKFLAMKFTNMNIKLSSQYLENMFYPNNLSKNEQKLFYYLDNLEKLEYIKINYMLLGNVLLNINCNYVEINSEDINC